MADTKELVEALKTALVDIKIDCCCPLTWKWVTGHAMSDENLPKRLDGAVQVVVMPDSTEANVRLLVGMPK